MNWNPDKVEQEMIKELMRRRLVHSSMILKYLAV